MNWKGPWKKVSDTTLNVKADNQRADEALTLYPEVDRQMDSCQEQAYAFLKWIVKYTRDPQARRAAQHAQAALRQAEELEFVNEANVAEGHRQVLREQPHIDTVIEVAEEERVRESHEHRQNGHKEKSAWLS